MFKSSFFYKLKILLTSYMLAAGLLFGSAIVVAETTPGADALKNGLGGKNASIQAAALETVGYHLQERMIDELNKGWATSIGRFLFVISIVSGIFIVAIGGSYKFALWFILGPAIYFQILDYKRDVGIAEWKIGDRKFAQDAVTQVKKATEGMRGGTDGNSETAKVLGIFSYWNNFTSSVIQTMIKFVGLRATDDDVTMGLKAYRYLMLNKLTVIEPFIKDLIAKGVIANCSEKLFLDKSKVGGSEVLYLQDQAEAFTTSNKLNSSQFNLNDFPSLQERVRKDPNLQKYITKYALVNKPNNTSFDCIGIWKLTTDVVRDLAEREIEINLRRDLPKGTNKEKFVKKIASKFDLKTGQKEAKISLDKPDPEKGRQTMISYVTARMILNEIVQVSPNSLESIFEQPTAVPFEKGADYKGNTLSMWTRHASVLKFEGKGAFLEYASTLPYVQGMILLFLSWTFPLFLFFLVVPGRHLSFLLWFALWFWAKSWDLGLAVVGLLDKIMFAMLPMGPSLTSDQIRENPQAAMAAVLTIDPEIATALYFNILATSIMAVPVITAVFIKKGGGEILGAVSNSLSSLSQGFGGSLATYNGSYIAQGELALVNQLFRDEVKKKVASVLTSDSVLGDLAKSTSYDVMTSKLNLLKFPVSGGTTSIEKSLNDIVSTYYSGQSKYHQDKALANMKAQLANTVFEFGKKVRRINPTDLGWSSHSTAGAATMDYRAVAKAEVELLKAQSAIPITGLADKVTALRNNIAPSLTMDLLSKVFKIESKSTADPIATGGDTPTPGLGTGNVLDRPSDDPTRNPEQAQSQPTAPQPAPVNPGGGQKAQNPGSGKARKPPKP